jgi:hypothetical protein
MRRIRYTSVADDRGIREPLPPRSCPAVSHCGVKAAARFMYCQGSNATADMYLSRMPKVGIAQTPSRRVVLMSFVLCSNWHQGGSLGGQEG